MELGVDLLQKIKKKKTDEIEKLWVARLEESEKELAWFLAVAEEMKNAKLAAPLTDLLVLLTEGLATEDSLEEAMEVLGRGLVMLPRSRELRSKVPEILRARFSHRDDLDSIIAFFKIDETEQPGKAFFALRDWLRFEKGAGFYLFGRGLGKVADVNLNLQKVQIHFEKATPLVVRRDEAQKLLTWIPPEHFMMRRLDDPSGVQAEAKADPGAFLRALSHSFRRALTAAEIRECMSGVIEGSSWNSWWTKAKAHPNLLPSKEKRNAFTWSDSSEEAEQTILSEFDSARFHERLDLARKHAKRGGSVKEKMIEELSASLLEMTESVGPEALELVYVLDEIGGLPTPSPIALDQVLASEEAADHVSQVGERRYREKMYPILRKARGEDWVGSIREAFFLETDFRLMTQLYEGLLEADEDGRIAQRACAEAVTSPRKHPRAFVWVTKNSVRRGELADRANHSLLSKVADSLEAPEFKDLKSHLREQFEPGGLAFVVFEKSNREEVDRLLSLIDAAELEEHKKIEIRRAIFRKYPDIRKRTDEEAIYVTSESVATKREELEQLVKVDLPANAEAIRVAREFGDLRENFEYHAARQKHELLNARASQLHEELKKIRLIDPSSVSSEEVSVGARVRMRAPAGSERVITILGPWDSAPEDDIYSYLSELAKGLLGKRIGEVVSFEEQDFEVISIEPWQSAEEASSAETAS